MRAPEPLSILEQIYHLESTSFIRYLIEVSRPPVLDDEDRRILALCQDLFKQFDVNSRAVGELLAEQGVTPAQLHWPLHYTNFNYLRPRYLLQPLLEKLERQHEQVEAHTRALAPFDWPEAKELLELLLEHERASIDRLRTASGETPEEPLEPPELKGTSASRW